MPLEKPVGSLLRSVIQFGDIPSVTWSKFKPGNLPPAVIEIWRFNLDSYFQRIPEMYGLLSNEEKAKSEKFRKEGDRQMFIASRASLRLIMSCYLNIEPREIRFSANKNKKPQLQNECNYGIHFNVSHSGPYILIAVSDEEIGVDIEFYKHLTILKSEMEHLFTRQEISFIASQNPPEDAFSKLWTRKEALLKGTSQGIIDNIKDLPCLNGTHVVNQSLLESCDDWSVYSFEAAEYCAASIAFKRLDKKVSFHEYDR